MKEHMKKGMKKLEDCEYGYMEEILPKKATENTQYFFLGTREDGVHLVYFIADDGYRNMGFKDVIEKKPRVKDYTKETFPLGIVYLCIDPDGEEPLLMVTGVQEGYISTCNKNIPYIKLKEYFMSMDLGKTWKVCEEPATSTVLVPPKDE